MQAESLVVNIHGRRVGVTCAGAGSPTVLLESGYGFDRRLWRDVLPQVAAMTRVCSYDRPGTGESDPPPEPRMSLQPVVDDLVAVLAATAIRPPYVLVGHSFGGFVVRLYASQHPASVVGLILVDAQSETIFPRQIAGLTPDQLQARAERLLAPAVNPERQGVVPEEFVAPLATAAPLPPMPVVVLTRERTANGEPLPETMAENDSEARWQAAQEELAQLLPGSVHRTLPNSGHLIPRQDPDAVVTAIREVLSQIH